MPTQRYRAKWALPISSPAITDAEIVVSDGLIAEVRPRRIDGAPALDAADLGNAVVMPGLVNAHTHLEYTLFRGLLDDLPFFAWIRELTDRRSRLSWDDWLASATVGAAEAAVAGITTVGDCAATGAAALGAAHIGLRGRVYHEVFGIDESVPVDAATQQALDDVAKLKRKTEGSRIQIGLSPHAVYTVRPALLRALGAAARQRGLFLCSHASESVAECQLTSSGLGVIGDRLRERAIDWRPPGCTPVEHLARNGVVGPYTLLVHGVQATMGDTETVLQSGASWVHCPKSNAKLANGVAPLGLLASMSAGRLGIGTDSVASNNGMDLIEEARFALLMQRAATRNETALSASEVLGLATLGGAHALGIGDQVGSLQPGKRADLAVMRLDRIQHAPVHDPISAVIYAGSGRDFVLTVVDGEPIARRGAVAAPGLSQARRRFARAAGRLRAGGTA